jgi:hypothetical protein
MEGTKQQGTATATAREALRALLREACRNEHMNDEMESNVVERLYGMVSDAIRAYAACRAYAWEGLAVVYELKANIDSLGVSAAELRNAWKDEMVAPPSPFRV